MSETPRIHTIKRGESYHGIAKRLTGSAEPGALLGYRRRLMECNPDAPSAPVVGWGLIVPPEWPAMPGAGNDGPTGQQRIDLLAREAAEVRPFEPTVEEHARQWRMIRQMTGWEFVRWAWSHYWCGTSPDFWNERHSNEDWGPHS